MNVALPSRPQPLRARALVSRREAEVLKLIGQGFRTRAIADKLGLSVKTIDSYKEHLKEKLHCNIHDLPLAAIRLGLVKVPVTGELRGVYPDLCDQ